MVYAGFPSRLYFWGVLVRRVVLGRGGPLLEFADKKIFSEDHFPKDSVCVGLVDEEKIHGVMVLTDYRGSTVTSHVAGAYRGWINRDFIRKCFDYIFNVLKVNTVLGLVRVDNYDTIRFDTKLGYRIVGTIPRGDDDGTDFYIVAMTRDQCRWLKEK